jgi:hypothetical protein
MEWIHDRSNSWWKPRCLEGYSTGKKKRYFILMELIISNRCHDGGKEIEMRI